MSSTVETPDTGTTPKPTARNHSALPKAAALAEALMGSPEPSGTTSGTPSAPGSGHSSGQPSAEPSTPPSSVGVRKALIRASVISRALA